MEPDRPPRILIVKLSAIGDVIHAMPVASALREQLPKAHIAWLVEERAAELLKDHAALNQLIVAPRRWFKSSEYKRQLREELRAIGFDVSIDLQGLTKSAYAGWASGVPRRIGFSGSLWLDLGRWFNNELFCRTMGREFSRLLNNEFVTVTRDHIVDQYLELLAPLGLQPRPARFDVPRFPEADARVSDLLRDMSLQRFALMSPGAGRPSKLWPAEYFAEVARHLGERDGLPTVVAWAGQTEHAWAKDIQSAAAGHVFVAPPTCLRMLAELARRASLFLASDTGPLHLAAAVGTPCVGLFSIMPARRNGPYGQGNVALQAQLRRGTSIQRHKPHNREMRAITPDQVIQACEQVLAASAPALPVRPTEPAALAG